MPLEKKSVLLTNAVQQSSIWPIVQVKYEKISHDIRLKREVISVKITALALAIGWVHL